jgi:hypothetical protein
MPSQSAKYGKTYKDESKNEDKIDIPNMVYTSEECEGLVDDNEHGSIKTSGNCTVIKEMTRVLS